MNSIQAAKIVERLCADGMSVEEATAKVLGKFEEPAAPERSAHLSPEGHSQDADARVQAPRLLTKSVPDGSAPSGTRNAKREKGAPSPKGGAPDRSIRLFRKGPKASSQIVIRIPEPKWDYPTPIYSRPERFYR